MDTQQLSWTIAFSSSAYKQVRIGTIIATVRKAHSQLGKKLKPIPKNVLLTIKQVHTVNLRQLIEVDYNDTSYYLSPKDLRYVF